jgi:hypothetical protein
MNLKQIRKSAVELALSQYGYEDDLIASCYVSMRNEWQAVYMVALASAESGGAVSTRLIVIGEHPDRINVRVIADDVSLVFDYGVQ